MLTGEHSLETGVLSAPFFLLIIVIIIILLVFILFVPVGIILRIIELLFTLLYQVLFMRHGDQRRRHADALPNRRNIMNTALL